jgi:arylsulfatase
MLTVGALLGCLATCCELLLWHQGTAQAIGQSGQTSAPRPTTNDGEFKGRIGRTIQESEPDWPRPPQAPPGAPNVVFIVLDDTGFAHLGCYGSDIATPNIDRLAAGGLRYNHFTTEALCSPTRAALLTGRNPHSVGVGTITELVNGFPVARGAISKRAGTLPEILIRNGYNAFALGKWHLTPMSAQSMAGPFDQWPTGRGFERFYGFLAAETHQFHPALIYDQHRVDPPKSVSQGYHLSEDLTDKAIEFINDQKSAAPDKPFFCYLAYGATHAPHHVPKKYIERYKGKFDEGWDRWREETLARQKKLGIVPANAQLAPHNPGVRAWSDLSPDQKKVFARMQEVFAGFLTHTDEQIGRLLAHLDQLRLSDNTLVILLSDNGASAEGGPEGTINELDFFNGVRPDPALTMKLLDELGGPATHGHYPWGWCQAGNTPFKWTKRFEHNGGNRVPFIVRLPNRIKDAGAIRGQFHHVTDMAPAVLEVAGITPPKEINGQPQMPLEGVSMAYSFFDDQAPSRKKTQYYEMRGNRAIYHDGWKAVVAHSNELDQVTSDFDHDRWELYNLSEDFSEINDLGAKEPAKLRELIERWWTEAGKYNVLPLDDRPMAQVLATRGAPPRKIYTYYPYISGLHPALAPNMIARSFSITANFDLADGNAEGVILARGGIGGGLSLFVKAGQVVFDYNYVGRRHHVITSTRGLPSGKSTLRFEFIRVGPKQAKGTMLLNGEKVGEGDIPELVPATFGLEPLDIGQDTQSPVSPAYEAPFRFTGGLRTVSVELMESAGR